ncbi:MAG: hypothetical protein D6808_00400 [Candidatus Dadabacteria bacterium]|nr:MAG: hypothetical protein D6808_00400 [Candidatus Dadabacteria bacterium]
MSVYALCNGNVLSADITLTQDDALTVSKEYKCLFTVLNESGEAKLAVDLCPNSNGVIDAERISHYQDMKAMLNSRGIHYLTVTEKEIDMLLDKDANYSFGDLLGLRVEAGDIIIDEE